VIYCVVPEVIVDRRHAERRTVEGAADSSHHREIRDRRRPRVTGEFPPIDPE